MNIDDMITVLQAAKDGKQIELSVSDAPWQPKTDYSIWNFGTTWYRVKPSPREFWVVLCGNQMSVTDGAKPHQCDKCLETIKVCEVLE